MAYDTITLGVASFMLVPGLLFMLKHKVLVAEIFLNNPAYNPLKRAAPTPSAFPLYASLAAYYLFLVGALAFCLASVILGLALDLPPAFAVCAGLTGMVTILLYMAVAGHSITGIPGVRGPPVPARIIIGTVSRTLRPPRPAPSPASSARTLDTSGNPTPSSEPRPLDPDERGV